MDDNIKKAIEDIELINIIIENKCLMDGSLQKSIDYLTELKGRYTVVFRNFQLNLENHYYFKNSQNKILYQRYNSDLVRKDFHTIKGVLDSFIRNKGKLDFVFDSESKKIIINNNNISTNTNTNTNLTEIKIEQVIETISNNGSIPQKEIDEILAYLSELENIVKGSDTKPKKWERIKDITKYILDKGIDIGITVLPYILSVAKEL